MKPTPRKKRPRLPRTIETIAAGEELSPSERWLLVVIVSHGSFARWSWPGLALLCQLTGFGRTTVKRLIASCENKGWLAVDRPQKHEAQRSNAYRVTPSASALAIVASHRPRKAAPSYGPPLEPEQSL